MDIIKLLEKPNRVHFRLNNNKIVCTLTGHELPPSADALLSYAGGKKFSRALAQHSAGQSAPPDLVRKFLVPAATVESGKSSADEQPERKAAGGPGRLFCQLTCRFLADTPADVARHLAGRRFLAARAGYEAARSAGLPFKPNTSLFARFRGHMTLEGLAGVRSAGGPGEDSSSEGDDEEQEEQEEDVADDEEELEADDSEEEGAESENDDDEDEKEEVQPPPPPPPQRKRKAEVKVPPQDSKFKRKK